MSTFHIRAESTLTALLICVFPTVKRSLSLLRFGAFPLFLFVFVHPFSMHLQMELQEYNYERGLAVWLSAGEASLPELYFSFSALYAITLIVWSVMLVLHRYYFCFFVLPLSNAMRSHLCALNSLFLLSVRIADFCTILCLW